MKRLLLASLLACCMVATSVAAPVAGLIRVSSTSVASGAGLTINYRLNQAADSVTIEVRDAGTNAAVATFAGTAAQGANSVVWNGRADNAGGAIVGSGTYRVRITANKAASGAWAEFASNRSVGNYGPPTILNTLFDGFSGRVWLVTQNTDSDAFGLYLAGSSYATTPPHAAAFVFNSDLSVHAGDDGFASRKLRGFGDGDAIINNTVVWGMAVDPDNPERPFVTGQATAGAAANQTGLMTAPSLTEENLVDADPLDRVASAGLPRGIGIAKFGGVKYAFLPNGNGLINRVQIDGSNQVVDAPAVDVLGGEATYSRDVVFDANNNMYYTQRGAAGVVIIYRWDAATVAAAAGDGLTPANAVWTITAGPNAGVALNSTITPSGDVYTLLQSGTERGLYYVGNVATATLTKTLSVADRVVDFAAIGTGWTPSNVGGRVQSDIAGNLYVTDNGTEQVRGFAPPTASSVAIVAPTSQTFTVTAANVGEWDLY
jgi:hypothetical protein